MDILEKNGKGSGMSVEKDVHATPKKKGEPGKGHQGKIMRTTREGNESVINREEKSKKDDGCGGEKEAKWQGVLVAGAGDGKFQVCHQTANGAAKNRERKKLCGVGKGSAFKKQRKKKAYC